MIQRPSNGKSTLEAAFHRALMTPTKERDRFLERTWGADRAFVEEVKSLLRSHVEDSFLESKGPLGAVSFFEPPREVGNYRLGDKLGSGGSSLVFLGRDKTNGQQVAVKILDPHAFRDDAHRARFVKSARIARQLQHRTVVSILDSGVDGEHAYLIMEYLKGPTLEELMQTGRLSHRQALSILADVAEGLDYAHSKGVVHRDIKPSNIVVDEESNARIIDFGLSRDVQHPQTVENVPCGTLAYMSPEQERGAEVDGRTDIFSLGLILYEILTRDRVRRQMHDRSIPKSIKKRCAEAPKEIDRVYRRAVHRDPLCRFSSAAPLARALRRLSRGRRTGLSPYWMHALKSRQGARLGIAAALGVALALLTSWSIGVASRVRDFPVAHFRVLSGDLPSTIFAQGIDLRSVGEWSVVSAGGERQRVAPGWTRFTRAGREGYGEWTMQVPLGGDIDLAIHIPVLPTEAVIGGMVRIPAGSFVFGSGPRGSNPYYAETLTLPTFYIDPTEVSNGDYDEFLRSNLDVERPDHWEALRDVEGWRDLPAVGMTAREATLFALSHGKRLPTVYELQRAARGTQGWLYPWGNDPVGIGSRAVFSLDPEVAERGLERYLRSAAPVGTQSRADRSPDGLLHVFGNVEEWTETPDMDYRWPGHSDEIVMNGARRVVHGFSFGYHVGQRVALDGVTAAPADAGAFDRGFRCAKSVFAPPP